MTIQTLIHNWGTIREIFRDFDKHVIRMYRYLRHVISKRLSLLCCLWVGDAQ